MELSSCCSRDGSRQGRLRRVLTRASTWPLLPLTALPLRIAPRSSTWAGLRPQTRSSAMRTARCCSSSRRSSSSRRCSPSDQPRKPSRHPARARSSRSCRRSGRSMVSRASCFPVTRATKTLEHEESRGRFWAMTATLPKQVQDVFDRFITTEYTTVDAHGQPITWPVTPYYKPGDPCIDVTTGLGYPKKAEDARRNPHVSMLFSDPTGSGLERPPAVLVQGTASVDDADLDANRERYTRESLEKLPETKDMYPPKPVQRLFQ